MVGREQGVNNIGKMDLECLLKIVLFFKESCKVDDDLRSGNLEVNNPVVDCLGGLRGGGGGGGKSKKHD